MASPAEIIHMSEFTKSPQLEDGYTRIANELMEAMGRFHFSSRQYSVLIVLLRKTYGYNKKSDDIGLSQLANMTGIDKANVSRTVRELESMHVIFRSSGQHGHRLCVNKNHRSWKSPSASGNRKSIANDGSRQDTVANSATDSTEAVANTGAETLPVVNLATGTEVVVLATTSVVDLAPPPVANLATTKDNLPKDKHQKTVNPPVPPVETSVPSVPSPLRKPSARAASRFSEAEFDKFWSLYPKKQGKQQAKAAWKKLAPDAGLQETILAAIETAKGAVEWMKESGQFIPMPTTWLNQSRWDDQLTPAIGSFTAEQQAFVDCFNDNIGDVCMPVTEWSQKTADLISLASAGKWDLNRWADFWRYVRDDCTFKGQVSFEWLTSRDNLVRVIRGEFEGARS